MDHEQREKNRRLSRLLIGGIGIVVIFLVIRAMLRLNYKLYLIRSEFWPTMKLFFWIFLGLAILVGLLLIVFNIIGKQAEEREKQEEE